MQTFFVEIKCKLGKTYAVASALADREIASEIYSTAGNYDILAKFHVDDGVDIGHFVAENVQTLPEIAGHPHDHHLQGVLRLAPTSSQQAEHVRSGPRTRGTRSAPRGGV